MCRGSALGQKSLPVESPEALFRELRPRDGAVRHLWAHQADLLRSYRELDGSDVALELPTGAGKTLVGLLLAEYRRRAGGRGSPTYARRFSWRVRRRHEPTHMGLTPWR